METPFFLVKKLVMFFDETCLLINDAEIIDKAEKKIAQLKDEAINKPVT